MPPQEPTAGGDKQLAHEAPARVLSNAAPEEQGQPWTIPGQHLTQQLPPTETEEINEIQEARDDCSQWHICSIIEYYN